jgi:predicted Zn-dependent protease
VRLLLIWIALAGASAGLAQNAPSGLSAPPGTTVPGLQESVSPQVAQAEAAIVKSDWKTAETTLDAWLAGHPTDARALFDAGYVADAQNRLDDAVALYRRAVVANPKSFEAQISLGLLLARQGKLADARPELKAATELDPGAAGPQVKARAWRALAQIDRQSDPKMASNDLLQALKLTPETKEDTLLAAELAEESGQPDAAEAEYRRLLATDPNSKAGTDGLAHVLMLQKKYAEAETLLRGALAKWPAAPSLTAELAGALAAQNKAEAVPLLQKLHEAHPNDKSISRMLADLLYTAGDATGSDALYIALLKQDPYNAGMWVAHGQNLIRLLKYEQADAAFKQATQIDPANGDAWGGLAFAALKLGQPDETLHALTMRSKYLPEVPATYFLWATAYDTLHDKVEAATYYHHFLEAAAGKFPDQEWQARQRLQILEKKH